MSQQVYIYTARADWSIAETAFQLAQLPLPINAIVNATRIRCA